MCTAPSPRTWAEPDGPRRPSGVGRGVGGRIRGSAPRHWGHIHARIFGFGGTLSTLSRFVEGGAVPGPFHGCGGGVPAGVGLSRRGDRSEPARARALGAAVFFATCGRFFPHAATGCDRGSRVLGPLPLDSPAADGADPLGLTGEGTSEPGAAVGQALLFLVFLSILALFTGARVNLARVRLVVEAGGVSSPPWPRGPDSCNAPIWPSVLAVSAQHAGTGDSGANVAAGGTERGYGWLAGAPRGAGLPGRPDLGAPRLYRLRSRVLPGRTGTRDVYGSAGPEVARFRVRGGHPGS